MNELSLEARRLIDQARPAEAPDPSAKARVQAALAAQLALPPAAPPPAPAAPAGASLLAGSGVKVVLLCALTTAAVVGTGVAVHRATRPTALPQTTYSVSPPRLAPPPPAGGADLKTPRPATRGEVAERSEAGEGLPVSWPKAQGLPAGGAERNAASPAPSAPESLAAAVPPTRPSALPTSRGSAPAPRPTAQTRHGAPPAPTVPVEHSMSTARARVACSAQDEIELLAGAQAALREHHGAVALVLLDRHAAACPSARFLEEHRAARVLALCLLHRQGEASTEAARLLAEAPRSPQLARLRSSCAAAVIQQDPRSKGGGAP